MPQDPRIEWAVAGVEGDEALGVDGTAGNHDRTVADARQSQQYVLDLADLDPEAIDLDLSVPPAEELQLSFRQPAAIVTAPVEATSLLMWIRDEGPPGAFGIVDVPAAHAHPGEDNLAWGAERHRRQVFVHDVHTHIVDGTAEWDALPVGYAVHDLVVGVVGGLGEPVRIDQRGGGLDREPALHEFLLQRLPRDRDAPQIWQLARVQREIRQQDFEVGRHDLNDADPAAHDPVDETPGVENGILVDQQSAPADKKGGNQLPG